MATKKKKKTQLNELQKNFCREYVKDFNGTRAYQRAGYKATGKAIETNASRLLRNDKVKAEIERLTEKVAKKQMVTAEMVVETLLEVQAMGLGKKDYNETVFDMASGEWITVKKNSTNLNAVNKSTELLGKYVGMFVDKVKLEAEVNANVNGSLNIDLSTLSVEELEMYLALQKKVQVDEDEN